MRNRVVGIDFYSTAKMTNGFLQLVLLYQANTPVSVGASVLWINLQSHLAMLNRFVKPLERLINGCQAVVGYTIQQVNLYGTLQRLQGLAKPPLSKKGNPPKLFNADA